MPGVSDILNPVSDVLDVGLGAVQTISGLVNLKKDKAAKAALKDPFYKIQDEFLQNKNQAEIDASGGLDIGTLELLNKNESEAFNTSVDAVMSSGATNPNDFAKLYGALTKSTENTAAANSAAHMKNVQYYAERNKELAGQKITQWDVNENEPYQRKLKELNENIKTDKSNVFAGFGTAAGALSNAGVAHENDGLMPGSSPKQNRVDFMHAHDDTYYGKDPFTVPSSSSVDVIV